MSYGSYPAAKFTSISAGDTDKLSYNNGEISRCRGIYVGGSGNLAVKDDAGNSVVFQSVPAGSLLPISTDQVLSTGTTATNLIALF